MFWSADVGENASKASLASKCQRDLERDRAGTLFRSLDLTTTDFRFGRDGGVAATTPNKIARAMECFRTSAESSNRRAHSINPLRSSGLAQADKM